MYVSMWVCEFYTFACSAFKYVVVVFIVIVVVVVFVGKPAAATDG